MSFYTFLPKLLNMSLTGAIAIICVLLLRLLLKRAPKVISYALWIVVLFRLLCPVSITSGLSLFGLLDAPSTSTVTGTSSIEFVPENIVHTEYPEVAIPVPAVSETINDTLPQGQEQLVADPLEAPVAIGTYMWFLGVMGMAVYSIISYARLKRKLLIVSPLQENIWLADEITTPFVMGLIHPRVYLPSDTEESQMPYLILHEKHHIRRGDHIFKALAFLALSIHWFNPLVWVAFVYANKDMEMSCDEAVVKKLGDHILADYTASLLSLATGKTIIAGVPLAFGEGDTKGRIRNLAHWKKPAFWVVMVAVIACIALGIGLLTNPEKEAGSEQKENGYYLLIGVEGVESIEVATANTSGGVINADGSAFRVGEKVWLEPLQGVTDLRGVSITALGAEGDIIYHLSVPGNASAEVVADIVGSDPWLLVPTTFEIPADDEVVENGPVVVKWTFSPMMSATWHAAFHFEFVLEHYTHIEATCDNGKLWNLQAQGQPRENEMRFEQGEPLCWTPEIEGENFTYVAENAFITFTVYDGEEVVSRGALDIVKTGEEDGQSFYEAQMTDTELLALWQEDGSNSAQVLLAGKGAIVSCSDLNHNRINERIVVRETEPNMLYELLVVENGTVIWFIEVGLPHVGWNTIMLYNEGGKDYLVEYQPQMYQGVGTYKCKMYSLEKGKESIKKEWAVDFELPAEGTLEITPDMELFAEEVGQLLHISGVLLSTEQGIFVRGVATVEELPQIYPVRFNPDEIWEAINHADLTSDDGKFPKNEEAFEELERVVTNVGLENAYPWNNTVELKSDADALIKMASDETGRFEIYGIMSAKYGTYGLLLNDRVDGQENWNFAYVPWVYTGAPSGQPILEPDGKGKYIFAYIDQYEDGVPWWEECILDCGYDTGHMELLSQDNAKIQENTEQSEIAVNTLDHVSMSMIKYKSWEGELEIVNHTGTELLTGQWYELQKLEDGVWQRVEQRADGMWEDVGYRLPTGETTSLPTNWKYLYGELSRGKYRIIKKVDVPLADRWDTYYLATEFDIL